MTPLALEIGARKAATKCQGLTRSSDEMSMSPQLLSQRSTCSVHLEDPNLQMHGILTATCTSGNQYQLLVRHCLCTLGRGLRSHQA